MYSNHIEFKILEIQNKYFILSIHEKSPDIYTGLYTHTYDGKIKPFKESDIKSKYESDDDENNSTYGYNDFLARGIEENTIYTTDNIEDALINIEILWNTNKYNI